VPLLARAERGRLVLRLPRRRMAARAVAVPAGVRHALEAEGPVTVWYLEPGLLDWPELKPGPPQRLSVRRLRALDDVNARLDTSTAQVSHAGVARVLEALRHEPSLELSALAHIAALSASRLRHAFREQVGVNVSRYRWWLRLRLSALSLRAGHSLTTAAHEAGFSDAAHFSRTFRRTFGFAPSKLLPVVRW
jgi:AraC-like DNA-binding protein